MRIVLQQSPREATGDGFNDVIRLEHYSHVRLKAKREALDALRSQSVFHQIADRAKLLIPLVPFECAQGRRPVVSERRSRRKRSESNGEMSEWLKEHAWKTIPASCIE